MKRISIAALLACCAVVFALAGCSGSQSTSSAVDEESIKGFWQLEESSQLGIEAVLNIDDENLAELLVGDGFYEGTWSIDGQEAKIVFEESFSEDADSTSSDAASDEASRTAKVSLSDGKLVLGTTDGSKLVFVKGDIDAYYGAEDESASASDASASDASAAEDDADADADVIDLSDDDLMAELGDEVEEVEPVIQDIKEVTVVDDDTATVKIDGKGTDNYGYVCYRLSVENKSKSSLELEAVEGSFKLDGKSVNPFIDYEEDIAAGASATVYLSFDDEVASADDLKNVTGEIAIYKVDSSSYSVTVAE